MPLLSNQKSQYGEFLAFKVSSVLLWNFMMFNFVSVFLINFYFILFLNIIMFCGIHSTFFIFSEIWFDISSVFWGLNLNPRSLNLFIQYFSGFKFIWCVPFCPGGAAVNAMYPSFLLGFVMLSINVSEYFSCMCSATSKHITNSNFSFVFISSLRSFKANLFSSISRCLTTFLDPSIP